MRALLIALVLLFPIGCYAGDFAPSDLTPEYEACLGNKDHQSNAAWGGCGRDEVQRQQELLDGAWKEALNLMQTHDQIGNGLPTLQEDQKLWIEWKEKACEAYSVGPFSHEAKALSYWFCKAHVISDRVKFLNGMISDLAEH